MTPSPGTSRVMQTWRPLDGARGQFTKCGVEVFIESRFRPPKIPGGQYLIAYSFCDSWPRKKAPPYHGFPQIAPNSSCRRDDGRSCGIANDLLRNHPYRKL